MIAERKALAAGDHVRKRTKPVQLVAEPKVERNDPMLPYGRKRERHSAASGSKIENAQRAVAELRLEVSGELDALLEPPPVEFDVKRVMALIRRN